MENKTQLKFPIISIIENELVVFEKPELYFICPKDYIGTLNKIDEEVLDSEGYLYKRCEVTFEKYINFFGGFSLRFARFGICFVSKEFERIKKMKIEDVKNVLDKSDPKISKKLKGKDFDDVSKLIECLMSVL